MSSVEAKNAVADIIIHMTGDREIAPAIFEDAMRRWSYSWKVSKWRMFRNEVHATIKITEAYGFTADGIGLIIRNAFNNAGIEHQSVTIAAVRHV